jgi:UDPglucose--hexose-1-phosphate uridylyltransferase
MRTRRDLDRRFAALASTPHRRLNPLIGEWVLVSPHRMERPWLGRQEEQARPQLPAHDPRCYLCPGNERARGARNPDYRGTFVFDNDFAALLPDVPPDLLPDATQAHVEVDGLLVADAVRGICRVICFSPRHDLHLASMEPAAVRGVVDVWADQTAELGALPWINHVQVFENRGPLMGASNPHPHCQVWAEELVPVEPGKELACQRAHRREHGGCLLCGYLELELADGSRLVAENDHFVALVPFWAVWPYELLLLPRAHCGALDELDGQVRTALAGMLQEIVARYDRLFGTPFPYSMGFHQRPADGPHPEWHLHAHYYPPLLRSATVPKFMVGYEMLGQPQRDLTAEAAAERLRAVHGGA